MERVLETWYLCVVETAVTTVPLQSSSVSKLVAPLPKRTMLVGTGYDYPDLPGLGNNNEKLGLAGRLRTGIQFRFRNLFHGQKIG